MCKVAAKIEYASTVQTLLCLHHDFFLHCYFLSIQQIIY
jgi:hypothetical protein